jgi:hypothetical protein
MTPTLITVINQMTGVSDADDMAYVRAQEVQFSRDVIPVWGQCPAIDFTPGGTGPSPGASPCWLQDTLDVPDALGYHDEDAQGVPYIKVGNLPGNDWRTTASHEFLELAKDTSANLWAQFDATTFVAYELADPVEGDSYDIDGIPMSNFVYPAWFDPQAQQGEKLDLLGKLSKPLTMTANGYMIVWTVTGQPTQKFGMHVHEVSPGLHIHFGADVPETKRNAVVAKYRKTGRRAPRTMTAPSP